jgi:hypothetical protein
MSRKRWRSLRATGIEASTLKIATGRASRIVSQTESKTNESLKKATQVANMPPPQVCWIASRTGPH